MGGSEWRRCATVVKSASVSLLNRNEGLTGSCSRITRRISSSPLFSAADKASGDPTAEVAALKPLLAEHGITLLDTSQANDTNVFVVTKATADKYGLSKVSDLAKKI